MPALVAVAGLTAAACTGEDAVPIRDLATTSLVTPHQLEPTEEMRVLARQQCLDDPDLEQGVVNAVDPARPDVTLASVTVECDVVRAGTDGDTTSTPGERAPSP